MYLLRTICIAVVISAFIVACSSQPQSESTPESVELDARTAFFQNLSEHCGNVYYGESVFPDNPEHELYGAALKMTVESCSDTEIRIPFQVNDDKSRTWILTLSDEGLLFKHDHRYDDGTPHDLTNYGGWASDSGTAFKQEFPADAETAEMLPEAVTNQWTMHLDLENNTFTYYLERHQQPRYKAVFSLN